MVGSGTWIPGLDAANGILALMAFSVAAAVVVAAVVVRLVLRGIGYERVAGLLWFSALALLGGLAGFVLLDRFVSRDQVAERRALETRIAELTAHTLAQGSPLGCLDAVANTLVENACEKPLFANAETVAAAVAYIDGKLSLLAQSAALAERDAGYRPSHERLRRGLEADRYGLVAHVLTTRGCATADCAELRLLRDPSRVAANMKARVFEAALGIHALAWPAGAAAVASVSPGAASAITTGVGHGPSPAAAAHASGGPKFDFPSASSIPAVSIMSAEPTTAAPVPAEPKSSAPIPPKRPPPAAAATTTAPRRQAAAPPTPPAAAGAPQAPTQITPPEPEPEPAAPVYDRHTR